MWQLKENKLSIFIDNKKKDPVKGGWGCMTLNKAICQFYKKNQIFGIMHRKKCVVLKNIYISKSAPQ